VPKTVQIRDVDDEVYAALARRAAGAGVRVPGLLRRHATRLAARPSTDEWLERTPHRSSDTARDDIVEALDELRGPDQMLVVDAAACSRASRGRRAPRRACRSVPENP
jgi:antitoxin FitA